MGEEFIFKCVKMKSKVSEFEFNLLLNKKQLGEKVTSLCQTRYYLLYSIIRKLKPKALQYEKS